jgi:hypothetical protein
MPLQNLNCYVAALGWEAGEERTDQRISYEFIYLESHIIPSSYPYRVRLKEKPYENSGASVSGFTEVDVMPTSTAQFYVDYEDSYAYFHSSQAGNLIQITYYGMGSAIVAADVNRFADVLNSVRDLLLSFQVGPMMPASTSVRMHGGYIAVSTTLTKVAEYVLDFGTGGAYETSALTFAYWAKLLVGINTSTGVISVTQGTEASTQSGATSPSIPANVKPCALVSIHDNGGEVAGSITNIDSTMIEDVRNPLS